MFLGEVSAQLDQARVHYLGVKRFPQFEKYGDVKVDVEWGKERSHDGDHDEDGLEGSNVGMHQESRVLHAHFELLGAGMPQAWLVFHLAGNIL